MSPLFNELGPGDVLLHHKNKSFHPISRITWILARLHLHYPNEQQVTNSPPARGPNTFSPAFGLLPLYALRVQQQLLVLAFTQLPLPLWKTLRASWRDCTCASLPLYSPVPGKAASFPVSQVTHFRQFAILFAIF